MPSSVLESEQIIVLMATFRQKSPFGVKQPIEPVYTFLGEHSSSLIISIARILGAPVIEAAGNVP